MGCEDCVGVWEVKLCCVTHGRLRSFKWPKITGSKLTHRHTLPTAAGQGSRCFVEQCGVLAYGAA